MELYHGSNQIVKQPNLLKGRKFLDFGSGFYLSDEKSQAENRAKSAALFFEEGIPTVNVFEWAKETVANLNVLYFPSANIEWLDFVLANRKGDITDNLYDIVIGPTANDKTILVIDQYMTGMFDNLENPKEFVIQLFQPQKLATQYMFATEKSLRYIYFTDSYTI
jgi:translation initiation factor RLI1